MSEHQEVGQGPKTAAERKATMDLGQVPGKALAGGVVQPPAPLENIGGKAAGTQGYKSFDH